MEPRITLITIGVSDLPRAVRFYRDGLSWPTSYNEGDPVAFFNTAGSRLSLYPLKDLAADIAALGRRPRPDADDGSRIMAVEAINGGSDAFPALPVVIVILQPIELALTSGGKIEQGHADAQHARPA